MDFIRAKHFTPTDGRSIDLLVIHDMEAPETHDRAEACARYFASTDREASAHYCIDDNSIVRCVRDQDVAWAAPGANSDGLQFELAGYAGQNRKDWLDPYSRRMLEDKAAPLFAELATGYKIPAVYLDAAALKQNRRGITTHKQVSLAFRLSSHTDPGDGFPIERFVDDVREIMHNPDDGPDDKPDLPTIRRGDVGWLVKKAQRHLRAHGFAALQVDGRFGQSTERAVRNFQRQEDIPADGVVGPKTWRRLRG